MSYTPRCLSLARVQRELGLSRGQVMELIETGALPAFQILGEWRVEEVMLERLIDSLYEQSTRPETGTATPQQGRDQGGDQGGHPAESGGHALRRRMTPQQNRIARLVGEGLSNAEIAERLSVEISTVKSHVSRMLQRLNMDNRQQLIAYLWRTGFITSAETSEDTLTLAGNRYAADSPERLAIVRPAPRDRCPQYAGLLADDHRILVIVPPGCAARRDHHLNPAFSGWPGSDGARRKSPGVLTGIPQLGSG